MKYLTFKLAKSALYKEIKLILENQKLFSGIQIYFILHSLLTNLIKMPEYVKDIDAEKLSFLNEKLSFYEQNKEFRDEVEGLYGDKELLLILDKFLQF